MADVTSRLGQAVSDKLLDLNLAQHDGVACFPCLRQKRRYSLELLALVDSKARNVNGNTCSNLLHVRGPIIWFLCTLYSA